MQKQSNQEYKRLGKFIQNIKKRFSEYLKKIHNASQELHKKVSRYIDMKIKMWEEKLGSMQLTVCKQSAINYNG